MTAMKLLSNTNDWKRGLFPQLKEQNKYDKFKNNPEELAKIIASKSLEKIASNTNSK